MISGIIKVEVSVISRSGRLRLRLITLTETLIIPDVTKPESNNIVLLYIVLKKIMTSALSQRSQFIFKHIALQEIMHCACNLQIIH